MGDEGFQKTCVALFHRLADASGAIALLHFRKDVTIDAKSDATPVTIADRDGEAAMRDLIRKAFPDHGIVGEEHGVERFDAEWLWILDPIDGTKSFINGVPLFGTLIGLWRRSVTGAAPILGCINHPALNERWLGGASLPTTLNGAPAKSRACARLGDAALYATSPNGFPGAEKAPFERLKSAVRQTRFGGTDCYHYAMVASGWTDIACEAGLKLHDYAAVVPVLEGAGARITDWNGNALALESETTVHGQVLACGDARVHAAALAALQG
jgi:inositol-phosphate phosphatase / L-galactose 1-phosphate phosphatase / histidinol-phosphatase